MHPAISLLLTVGLVHRAYSRKSLTPLGILTAAVTALIHAAHPWSNLTMALLFSFYILGTAATKVKHDVKSKLTISADGSHTTATTRTHVQVLANSVTASGLILAHMVLTKGRKHEELGLDVEGGRWEDAMMVGVMAHYAATTSDTLSSELGILSTSQPRLILPPFRVVPPGTNGGVSLTGLLSGATGSAIIALLSVLLTPLSASTNRTEIFTVVLLSGIFGTILDSVLGALLQASVVDVKRGKVVEAEGGGKVLTGSHGEESRKVLVGRDVLSNNGVNLLMAFCIAMGGVGWGLKKSGAAF